MALTLLIISVLVLNAIAALMPKRLTKLELWVTSFFALVLVLTVDIYLDLKLDLYGYFGKGVNEAGFLAIFGLYPAVNMIFLNYFPFTQGAWRKTVYIMGWSAFALIYEWMAVLTGMFYHNGWTYWYSVPAYPLLYLLLLWHLKVVRELEKRR